ncbi:large T-antigen [bat polyomavirus 4a]|uniref:Large T antigen n=1 Tax=bat polyomavirus 4a TaxID=2758137 RepID=J3TNZ7_9POLY|nr:large T-antigen [Alphapolyomavirus tertarplanisrostris]AFP94199.1 large T-antigen [bat polyomavirus 4a]
MDKALNREESQELMQLLGLSMTLYGQLPMMRKAYLNKCKEYHPDKGGDEQKMKRMNELYKKLEDALSAASREETVWTSWASGECPTYGSAEWDAWWREFNADWEENLRCDEEMPDFDEDNTQSSQHTPPKKKFRRDAPSEFPEVLLEFLSKAVFSNKCVSAFLIYTTKEKSVLLYRKVWDKFSSTFISRHSHGADKALLYVLTPNKHRVSAINNFCKKFCSISFVLVKAIIKPFPCYCALGKEPFELLDESVPGGLTENVFMAEDCEEGQKQVNWKQISDYACAIKCDDVHLLMGLYLEFEFPVESCGKCDKQVLPSHFKYHKDHLENAKLFAQCKNQKSICQQAVDAVIAKKRVDQLVLTRKQMLTERFVTMLDKMDAHFGPRGAGDLREYMAGVCWLHCPIHNIEEHIVEFLQCIVSNVPKRRYWLFKGPVNSGKTTLAAALLDLVGGKALNINLPFERINFELGVAIDQYMIVFEDVKGTVSTKDLPQGLGLSNLDNLRDYLDGSVKVNLEKKHLNKRTQIFPPGIVTMNEYVLPTTLSIRFVKTLNFRVKNYLSKSLRQTEELLEKRILQSGMTLMLMLVHHCLVQEFDPSIQARVVEWKERLDREVGDDEMNTFLRRIAQGKYILEDEEEDLMDLDQQRMPPPPPRGPPPPYTPVDPLSTAQSQQSQSDESQGSQPTTPATSQSTAPDSGIFFESPQ